MSKIIARVRDAIEVAVHKAGGFDSMSQEDGNAVARAAIEAMREPTAEMKSAGDNGLPDHIGYADDAAGIYRTMIDAALTK